jgi:mannose-6-phosphate isomerase-like protein (cupin superfamily)
MKIGQRFVTGVHDGKSQLLSQEKVSGFVPYALFPSFSIHELFYTQDTMQSLATRHLSKDYNIDLPKGAMRIMTIRMPTTKEMERDLIASGQAVPDDWYKHNIHNTDSVDYIFVLSGSIECVTGDDVFVLKQGDFLAQVGPDHTWVNPNDEPCYVLAIMVGIEPSGNVKKMTLK